MPAAESEKTKIPIWIWLLVGLCTFAIFGWAYWRTGSIIWSSIAVVVEFGVAAMLAAADAFYKWLNE